MKKLTILLIAFGLFAVVLATGGHGIKQGGGLGKLPGVKGKAGPPIGKIGKIGGSGGSGKHEHGEHGHGREHGEHGREHGEHGREHGEHSHEHGRHFPLAPSCEAQCSLGQACSDNNPCTAQDTCVATLHGPFCVGKLPLLCPEPPVCHENPYWHPNVTANTCTCRYQFSAHGTHCPGGRCNSHGECVAFVEHGHREHGHGHSHGHGHGREEHSRGGHGHGREEHSRGGHEHGRREHGGHHGRN